MRVRNNIKGKVYNKLIEYVFEQCDTVSMRKYCNQQEKETNRISNIILSDLQYSIGGIVETYSEDFLEKIYTHFKDNSIIFNQKYKEDYKKSCSDCSEEFYKNTIEYNKKNVLYNCIMWIYYNKVTENFTDMYHDDLILKKDYMVEEKFLEKPLHHSIIYYFNFSEKIKNIVNSKNDIYSWCFPLMLEDISFYKDGYCWLDSIAHEELCFIYCKDEEEYKYLKSIGIEFVEDKFVPISKDELYYVDYK